MPDEDDDVLVVFDQIEGLLVSSNLPFGGVLDKFGIGINQEPGQKGDRF